MAKLTPHQKMTKARSNLVMGSPFFGTLAIRMKLIEKDTIDTMETDGQSIWYSPKFVNEHSEPQLTAVIAHEVLHGAFLHHTRRGDRNPYNWNVAGDHAINLILEKASFDLPKPNLCDPQYAGMSAEAIYALLPPPPPGGGSDPGGCGGVIDAPRGQGQTLESAKAQAEQEMRQALASAAQMAREMGKLPADLERLIDECLESVVPWKDILRRFCTEIEMGDVTWNRPQRRLIDMGLYLPSADQTDPHMKSIVVMVDTSGSIGPTELAEFGGEINAIHQDVQPFETIIIYCDAAINGEPVRFGPDDEVVLEPRGGGGTDFKPPFDWIEANLTGVQCAVYLTDGYGDFPQEQDFPVLWAMTSDVNPPFGETVRIR